MPVLGTLVTCSRCQTPILVAIQKQHKCGYSQRRGSGDRRCRDCGAMVPPDKRRGHRQTTDCRVARKHAELRKKGLVALDWTIVRYLGREPYNIDFGKREPLLQQYVGPAWLGLMHQMLANDDASRLQIAKSLNLAASLGMDYDSVDYWDMLHAVYLAGGPTARQKTLLLSYKLRAAQKGK